MIYVDFTTDVEGSSSNLSGNHGGEIEAAVAATDSGSCAVEIDRGVRNLDGTKTCQMSCLATDVPKYDDSTDDDEGYEIKGGDMSQVHDTEKEDKKGDKGDKVKGEGLEGVPPFDQQRANRNALIFLSLLLVVAMAVVMCRSSSNPLIAAWRLSLLICCCCTIWTSLLATTLSASTMLSRIIFVTVLALYLDVAVDPKIGVLVVHFNSHFAAGMMGHALAERRQHDGAEVSYAAVAISSKKQADRRFCAQILGGVYFSMITLGVVIGVAWVVCNAADYTVEQLVAIVSLLLSGVLTMWITYVGGMLLQGPIITETEFSALILYFTFTALLYAWSVMTIGEIWAMMVTWFLSLGFSGMFGYCICVYFIQAEVSSSHFLPIKYTSDESALLDQPNRWNTKQSKRRPTKQGMQVDAEEGGTQAQANQASANEWRSEQMVRC